MGVKKLQTVKMSRSQMLHCGSIEKRKNLLDVVGPVEEEHDSENPLEEVEDGGNADKHEPEPHQQVDLLVENVDRHHTLHSVVMSIFS